MMDSRETAVAIHPDACGTRHTSLSVPSPKYRFHINLSKTGSCIPYWHTKLCKAFLLHSLISIALPYNEECTLNTRFCLFALTPIKNAFMVRPSVFPHICSHQPHSFELNLVLYDPGILKFLFHPKTPPPVPVTNTPVYHSRLKGSIPTFTFLFFAQLTFYSWKCCVLCFYRQYYIYYASQISSFAGVL